MTWLPWLLIALGVTAVLLAGTVVLTKQLQKREPYRSVLRLGTRAKLRLFKALVTDRRVPLFARALPLLLALYLAMPFDLVPDFIPVLGYVDDVAVIVLTLALMVRLTPRTVIEEHMARLEAEAGRESKTE